MGTPLSNTNAGANNITKQNTTSARAAIKKLTDAALVSAASRIGHMGGWAVDLVHDHVYWSDEVAAIHDEPAGVSPTVQEGINYYAPEWRQQITDLFTTCSRQGIPYDAELQIITAAGRRVWVRVLGEAVRDAKGNIVRVQGAFQDITERYEAQHALEISEQRFKAVAAAITDAIWDWDLLDDSVWWSDGLETLFGYRRDEVEPGSDSWTNRLHEDDRERVLQSIQEFIDGIAVNWEAEYRFICKDSSVALVRDRARAIRDAQGRAVRLIGGMSDLTAQRAMEERLLRVQRLESLGTMAGDIAHDLNNVLAPILLSLPLLKNSARDAADIRRLEMLETSIKRGVEMVRQVLTFARGAEGRNVRFAVRDVVQDVAMMMRETLDKKIQIHVNQPDGAWPLVGDPTHLHQMLVNLCLNARDAMPYGGVLTLAAENRHLDENYATVNPEARPGPYVILTVADTGFGIPRDVRERIFDPFFTTKAQGSGTGLGLSTVQGLVKGYHGFITVYSEEDKGTAFKLYLPAGPLGPVDAIDRQLAHLPRGNGETILVVDDEMAVRNITKEVLEANGYRVLLAEDGALALSVYAQHRDEIDVVLTDMMMPVMDGYATILALRRINPGVKIIAASGLAANGMVAKAAGAGVHHFLPKPYTTEALLTLLQNLLG